MSFEAEIERLEGILNELDPKTEDYAKVVKVLGQLNDMRIKSDNAESEQSLAYEKQNQKKGFEWWHLMAPVTAIISGTFGLLKIGRTKKREEEEIIRNHEWDIIKEK